MKHNDGSSAADEEGLHNKVRSRTWSGTSSIHSYTCEDDRRLTELSSSNDFGADLLGLSLAASMVGEHARLSWEEASVLTTDVTELHSTTLQASQRAIKAEKMLHKLYRVTHNFKQQLDVIKLEKKLLVKEVKQLRNSQAVYEAAQREGNRNSLISALESYVAGALKLHETTLKQAVHSTRAEQDRLNLVLASITSNEEEDAPVLEVATNTQGTQTDPDDVVVKPVAAKPDVCSSTTPRSVGFGTFSGGALGFGSMKRFQNAHLNTSTIRPSLKESSSLSEHADDSRKTQIPVQSDTLETNADSQLPVISKPDSSEKENINRPYTPLKLSCVTPIHMSKSFVSYTNTPRENEEPTTPAPSRMSNITFSPSVPSKISLLPQHRNQFMSPMAPSPVAHTGQQVDLEIVDSIVLRSLSLPEEMSTGGVALTDSSYSESEIGQLYDAIDSLYEI